MIFKDIKTGYPVYFLQKDGEPKAYQGKVVTVSQPRFQQLQPNAPLQQATAMVVDVTVEASGETKTYTIPETSSVVNAGSLVLSVDRDGILREVEAVKSQSEESLRQVDHHKATVSACEKILEDWNPAFREKQETEKRFSKIEESVGDIKKLMTDIYERLK